MAHWILIILVGLAVIGVTTSAIANQREHIRKKKEKQYAKSKAMLAQLEPIIESFLRIDCRQDIIDCLINFYKHHTHKLTVLFPKSIENQTFQERAEKLALQPKSNLEDAPLLNNNDISLVQSQVRQFTLLLSTLRQEGLTTPTLSEEWSKYLKKYSAEIEITAYMAQSERLLDEGDRSKASNCLRTAQSKLNKAPIDEELKKQLHNEITTRIRAMYGLKSEGGDNGDTPPVPDSKN